MNTSFYPFNGDSLHVACGVKAELFLTDALPRGIQLRHPAQSQNLTIRFDESENRPARMRIRSLDCQEYESPVILTLQLGPDTFARLQLDLTSTKVRVQGAPRLEELLLRMVHGRLHLDNALRAERAHLTLVQCQAEIDPQCSSLDVSCTAVQGLLGQNISDQSISVSLIASKLELPNTIVQGIGTHRFGTGKPCVTAHLVDTYLRVPHLKC